MIEILTPDEVTQREADEKLKRVENMNLVMPIVTDQLASHVKSCWEIAQTHRVHINGIMLDCLRRRKGEYDDGKLSEIRAMGGSEIYMQITGAKCSGAKAWLEDIFAPTGVQPWTITPTPTPDLPPHLKEKLVTTAVQGALQMGLPYAAVQELVTKHADRLHGELEYEGQRRAERMTKHIADVLTEGRWRKELSAFLDDLVTYPLAIMRGLIYRRQKVLAWSQDQNGNYTPVTEYTVKREVRRISPFDFYPSPSAVDVNDDWVIERHRMTASDLTSLRGAAGYNGKGIAMALRDYRYKGIKEFSNGDHTRETLENRSNTTTDENIIEALEWSGKIQGKMLLEWGMESRQIPDPLDEYLVSITVVGEYVIRALVNPDPTDRNDYFVAHWRSVPNSIYGDALPMILSDCQDMANAAARALSNNMGIASAPMVSYIADRLVQGQDVTHLHPWKIFGTTESRTGSTAAPVSFFQPNSHANELLAIYERFTRYADDISGIPQYALGSDGAKGAGATASGLSMLMNHASKGIKQVVRNVDINVIEPLIKKIYNHLMLDPNIPADSKGDLNITAMGSDGLLHKEANAMLQQQFMAQTANEFDMQILGIEGRRELIKSAAKNLDIPVDKVVPDMEMMMMQNQVAQAESEVLGNEEEESPDKDNR